MERLIYRYDNGSILQASCAEGVTHLMIHADVSGTFEEQLAALHQGLEDFLGLRGKDSSVVFMRYFLSDAANQAGILDGYLAENRFCAVSVVEQPPLDGSKVALWVCLMEGAGVSSAEDGLWEVDKDGCRHLWLGGSFCRGGDSERQMRQLLEGYQAALKKNGCSLEDDCIRTWIFVQNVDVNYAGIVKARREVFQDVGLTKDTHYIASTGIAGRNAYPDSSVVLDAYAVAGLQKSQVRHLYGATHLNPTYEYGVTFERGTAVDYADRRDVFISGTASIDNKGQILHPGDVVKQCERLLENVSVLLAEADCAFKDVMSMIVYLRDISDYDRVRRVFNISHPQMPVVFLWAPVCRPGWLVEMECMAVKGI